MIAGIACKSVETLSNDQVQAIVGQTLKWIRFLIVLDNVQKDDLVKWDEMNDLLKISTNYLIIYSNKIAETITYYNENAIVIS